MNNNLLDIKNLSVWHDISEKLLTKSGTWRKISIVKSLIEKLKQSDLLRKRLETTTKNIETY